MKVDFSGATRIVLIFKDFVVKIPTFKEYKLFLHGLLANLQERLWSGQHDDLCPVLHSSRFGFWLVMKKADVSLDSDNQDFLGLPERYSDDYLKDFLLSDYKPNNWGYLNGRYVKIDYGN